MLPDYVILDPELSYATAPYQTAVSGMDALCQGVESYWSVHSTEQSRDYAKTAITTILDSLEDAVQAGSSIARQRMSRGANFSGKAINITKTTAPHALSYGLTSHYEIPHGHAVALMLGRFFLIHEANKDSLMDRRGKQYFSRITEELYEMLGCRDARSCTESWYHRMGTIGLETDFARLGLTGPKDHDLIVKGVNPGRMANHPVHLTRELLTQLFA
jgi:alcohol dehydrogenase class IV